MRNLRLKALSLFLLVVFCCSFCALFCSCSSSGNNKKYEKTAKDYIRDEIKYELRGRLYSSGYSLSSFTTNIVKDGKTRYEVSGKVTVKDKYGDLWTGNYDAVVYYDADSDSYSVSSFSMGKIYKQR